ncbi:MAG: ribokinase [Planctomycetota bacterium]
MKSNRPRVVVLGSINMDLVIQSPRIPIPGETLLASSSTEFCGGKGANQAVAAARAGGDVAMIGAVGGDGFASRLIENLRTNNIDFQHVRRRDDVASGLAVIAVDDNGQNAIMVVPGANALISVEDVERSRELIQDADILLLQLEIPVEAVTAGVEIAKQSETRVMLDPAPAIANLPPHLLDVDLLCPNEREAQVITGMQVGTDEQVSAVAKVLQQRGATHVAVTLGEGGTHLRSDGQSQLFPSFKVGVADTTAAGDAFAGTLAVKWSEGETLPDAIRWANAAGAMAATRRGAQASMASGEEVQSFLESHI